jgi:hypothetical protein
MIARPPLCPLGTPPCPLRARLAVARAKSEHPYEVPGVSARPIIDGNPDYLAWIAKETATTSARTDRPPDADGPPTL